MIGQRLLTALVVTAGLCFATITTAAENVWSVEAFNNRKADWDQLAGATIHIEGRVSLVGGGQLRLLKCEVPFHASGPLFKVEHGGKAVEISGRLKKDNGKLIFFAESIKIVPTDMQYYESRFARLRNPKATDWYELGDWASERSLFYEDAELNKKALSAYDRGITVEWRAMDPQDADARFELAKKVADYKLSDARRMELIHEGDRILWQQALKAAPLDENAWTTLSTRLAKDLPGSTEPLKDLPDELRDQYEREPLVVYRESTDDVRRVLHRIFYVTVQLKRIVDDAAKNGSNGDAIADRLARHVPEARPLVENYRQLKLNWRLEQASQATRPEVEQLAAEFRKYQKPEKARLAVTRWLQARESTLRQDGPVGLLQLADEYLSLLQDERKAVVILAEAHKIDPGFADVTDKLKSLGYVNAGGTWIPSKPDSPLNNPLAVESNPGTIEVGMNGAAVRNAMGGRPGSLGRVLTRHGVSEVWSYGQPGSSRLIIRLEGTALTPDLRVIDIKNER